MKSNHSHWFCQHIALPGKMQDNFAFANPLSVQYLSFNNVYFTGGKSLFCILCMQWQWLQCVAECRDDSDICADHPGAWLLFKTLFSPEAFGRWEEVIYISSSRWNSWRLKHFSSFSLPLHRSSQTRRLPRSCKINYFPGITIIWCEESKATSV